MNNKKQPTVIIVGLAFFSMFFGSGNLIFPLMLGVRYGNDVTPGILGFILTAVVLPMLGVFAMIPAKGRYENLFSGSYPQIFSKIFTLIVLLFWIPLGSGPRCVILAHSSLQTYLPFSFPISVFAFCFLFLCFLAVANPNKILNFLGKILTPMLLLSIGFIILGSFFDQSFDIKISSHGFFEVLTESFIEGYYTQDLIASIFFSCSLVSLIQTSTQDLPKTLRLISRGGGLAGFILFIIYGALMLTSAAYQSQLQSLSADKLVSHLAQIVLGSTFGIISSITVSLACLTTEIALIVVFSDFLKNHIFQNFSRFFSIFLTLGMIWGLALFPFQKIMNIIDPAMKIIYPILIFFCIKSLCIWILNKKNDISIM